MRILPRNHDGVNEEWISDKTRFVWDGLRRQRLDRPYIRENGKLKPRISWGEALAAAGAMKGKKVAGLLGIWHPEAAFALKQIDVTGLGGRMWNAAQMGPYCRRTTDRPMWAMPPLKILIARKRNLPDRNQPARRSPGSECAYSQGLDQRRQCDGLWHRQNRWLTSLMITRNGRPWADRAA